MQTKESLKAAHDVLLAHMPEGAVHEAADCELCQTDPGGQMTTFTEEQVAEKIREALATAEAEANTKAAALQSQLDELKQRLEASEADSAITEATKPLQDKIDQMQAELDSALAEKAAADQALADRIAADEQAEADRLAAEELAKVKDERVTEAKELSPFDDEFIAENADRFASLTAEAWDERKTEWAAIAAKHGKVVRPPAADPLEATRHIPGGADTGGASHLRDLATATRTSA